MRSRELQRGVLETISDSTGSECFKKGLKSVEIELPAPVLPFCLAEVVLLEPHYRQAGSQGAPTGQFAYWKQDETMSWISFAFILPTASKA